MGSERIIKQILGLDNIKEAVLFPRDVKRITP
jgi:aspartyl/asparaginyl-tRNA synthetase